MPGLSARDRPLHRTHQILFSFPLALIIYRVVFGVRMFESLHSLAVFIILGIGAGEAAAARPPRLPPAASASSRAGVPGVPRACPDDVFVFVDAWNQYRGKKDLVDRMQATYVRAGKAMFVTCVPRRPQLAWPACGCRCAACPLACLPVQPVACPLAPARYARARGSHAFQLGPPPPPPPPLAVNYVCRRSFTTMAAFCATIMSGTACCLLGARPCSAPSGATAHT